MVDFGVAKSEGGMRANVVLCAELAIARILNCSILVEYSGENGSDVAMSLMLRYARVVSTDNGAHRMYKPSEEW